MNALLSIKPKYVNEIIEGNKKIEFRKTIFNDQVKEVWIYASSPIKKIVGVFIPGEIVEGSPKSLWRKYKSISGMGEDEYFHYFHGKDIGYAMEIDSLRVFIHAFEPNEIITEFTPPQSFCYFNTISYEDIKKKHAATLIR